MSEERHEALLAGHRALTARLTELDAAHLRRVGAGAWFGALGATAAATAVAVLAVTPLLDPAGLGWFALLTLPVGAGAGALAWRAVRRLTTPYGPVGAECQAALRERDGLLDSLYALPPAATASSDWAGIDDVHRWIAEADAAAALTAPGDAGRVARRAGRGLPWLLAALALTGVLAPLAVVVPLAVAAEPGLWGMLLPLAVLLAGAGPALRIAYLRAVDPPRRVTRTQRRGWRAELAYREHRLTAGAGIAPWRFPAFHTQRLWLALGGPLWRRLGLPAHSPADVLRELPAGASPFRVWYWRHVGPGTVTLLGLVLVALVVVTVRTAG
ncbi:hypothetical protein [Streptomyces mayteni]